MGLPSRPPRPSTPAPNPFATCPAGLSVGMSMPPWIISRQRPCGKPCTRGSEIMWFVLCYCIRVCLSHSMIPPICGKSRGRPSRQGLARQPVHLDNENDENEPAPIALLIYCPPPRFANTRYCTRNPLCRVLDYRRNTSCTPEMPTNYSYNLCHSMILTGVDGNACGTVA